MPKAHVFIARNHDETEIVGPDGGVSILNVRTPDDTGVVVTLELADGVRVRKRTDVIPRSAVVRELMAAVESES